MSTIKEDDLFQSSHLTLLVSYTIFATILVVESFLMGWELWALLLVAGGIATAWVLHIRHNTPANVRIWVYAVLIMGCFFFYGIHDTSTFDLALVMGAIIMLNTMSGKKSLITLCQFTFYITMGYSLINMIRNGTEFDVLLITRTLLHFAMVYFIGRFAKVIIDKWMEVLNTHHRSYDSLHRQIKTQGSRRRSYRRKRRRP